jgi:2-dehydropantoate 2-reductase
MKIAVMGAGGVGGYYGAVLARAGEDVTFIARGAHLEAIRKAGLKVESQAAGNFALPQAKATDNPADIGPVHLILFATKAYDLEAAAAAIKPCLGAETVILPLLNGVDIADRIAAVVGRRHVLGGMCQISAAIQSPGLIRTVGPLNKIVFGELAGGTSARVQAVHQVLVKAGINAELSEQVLVEIWNKFLFICALGGVCTVTATVLGPVRSDPDTRALLVGVMEEVHALARRQGVALKPTVVADTLAAMDKLPEGTRPSMLLSLEQGAKLEVDALNGTAARLGRQLGVPTPINQFIFAALKLRAGGRPG